MSKEEKQNIERNEIAMMQITGDRVSSALQHHDHHEGNQERGTGKQPNPEKCRRQDQNRKRNLGRANRHRVDPQQVEIPNRIYEMKGRTVGTELDEIHELQTMKRN